MIARMAGLAAALLLALPVDAEPRPPVRPGEAMAPRAALAPPSERIEPRDASAVDACRLALSWLGARVRTVPPDPALPPACAIAQPVAVETVAPGVPMDGAPVMDCATARALALWAAEFVQPAARMLPGAPRLTGLVPGSAHACRARIGDGSGKLSEHATGNAIDIAGFRLSDGRTLAVAPPADRGDADVAFQAAVRGSACLLFTTVLGPGSDGAHDGHLHFDLRARAGGLRLCQ